MIAGIAGRVGWHTFRHSYRSWLDDTLAPLTVQKELMRHASIQTTMNVYGTSMTDSKRQAHGKIVRLVLNAPAGRNAADAPQQRTGKTVLGVIGSFWELEPVAGRNATC